VKRVLHVVELERLDDRFDLLHLVPGALSLIRCSCPITAAFGRQWAAQID
jgi:hypothetical protein